jgi:hypothetical protein
MAADPAAMQLRLLQTVTEVAAEKNSTLVMPFPVELLRFFEHAAGGRTADPVPAAGPTDEELAFDAADMPELEVPPIDLPPVDLPAMDALPMAELEGAEVPPPPSERPGSSFLES